MYTFRAISLLSTLLLVGLSGASTTTVGIETEEGSRSVQVPLNECHQMGEFEVYGVFISRTCRLFTGVGCTGRTTLLQPGQHSSSEAVYIDSLFCYP
ncbi:hypothetical protein BO94DRAFT_534745 [Aspergillus sclerotioniger CBS 115572]|uniref:Uncharacterized protein n=1 Tax=Aspergillus sclerotioniger CBS 115572 TaxID=1450535 RepID=A0A317WU80_9EURO|nr:hypothetical protein BO94DRAFT_534745 [Aspergillus sclerotioniger CBS 115572]PWY88852.1 hypothetical protein BO94DRAFT_534745 [Aspergillus sclerotioniger CBS 115572]